MGECVCVCACMCREVLECILLNTINPLFIFGEKKGPKGVDTGSAACSRLQLLVLETWRSAAGDQRKSWT